MAQQMYPNLVAVGTIRPYRAVAPTGSADNACGESNANNLSLGVVSGDTKSFDSANHAEADDQVSLQTGNVLLIELGSGGATRGNGLKSDADGKGVEVATSGATLQYHLGVALESGAEGAIVRMLWQPQAIRPALS